MIKDKYVAILKAVEKQGMLNARAVEKEHRETVEELIEQGLLKHVKEREYELTHDGEMALGGYKRHDPRKYRWLKIDRLIG